MEQNKIYLGDNIEILKTFPDNSIDCCITSPPYYGLRDYGTGKWIGGDPNCSHKRKNPFGSVVSVGTHKKMAELGLDAGNSHIFKQVCPYCGAVREDKQVGLEETPEEYIDRLVSIFREVKRVLKDTGTLWVNIGDTYYGSGGGRGSTYHDSREDVVQSGNKGFNDMLYAPVLTKKSDVYKPKDMIGIPWMLAFALRADGWYLRQDIIWHKPNPMPESVKDRCTKSHEYIFLLSKSRDYYFDYESIQEKANIQESYSVKFGGNKYGDNNNSLFNIYSGNEYEIKKDANGVAIRNKRDVWSICPSSFKGAHFATFPEDLVLPMILAGCPKDGIVLDPFMGSGTVGVVAKTNHRNYIGIDLNEEYVDMANKRLSGTIKKLI